MASASSTRHISSPGTPEVVVSSMPLPVDKENVISASSDKPWHLHQERSSSDVGLGNGNESTTSSSSSGTGTISIQERVRLIGKNKNDDIRPNLRKFSKDNVTELSSFKVQPSDRIPSKDTSLPVTSSPTSGSYAIISLRDGLDEQRFMVETDLMSVTTTGSTANIMFIGASKEDEEESDYYTPMGDDPQLPPSSYIGTKDELSKELRNVNIKKMFLINCINLMISLQIDQKTYMKLKNPSSGTIVKLAEIESTDDLDLSSVDD